MSPDSGDYATSKYLKWHRGLSVTVVGVVFVCYAESFGIGMSIRPFAGFVMPLLLIWFSDSLGAWGSKQSGNWFSNVTGDTYVRICAWLMLLVLCTLRIMTLVSIWIWLRVVLSAIQCGTRVSRLPIKIQRLSNWKT